METIGGPMDGLITTLYILALLTVMSGIIAWFNSLK